MGEQVRMDEVEAIKEFILAGNATFTLESLKTGSRFTYSVKAKEKPADPNLKIAALHFVAYLRGSENTKDYAYLGTIFDEKGFRHTTKSRVGADSPVAQAFAWFWEKLQAGRLPETCAFYHMGACGKCGRPLTVPESIKTGLGPICARRGG